MISPTVDTIRLTLHILGAAVWVGGQITLAGLVPGLRARDPELPALVARRFAVVAWSGFAVAFVTGIWNLFAVDLSATSTTYHATLGLKLVLVAVTGVAALLHSISRSKVALAVGGAVGLLAGLGAVFVGVLLAGS